MLFVEKKKILLLLSIEKKNIAPVDDVYKNIAPVVHWKKNIAPVDDVYKNIAPVVRWKKNIAPVVR